MGCRPRLLRHPAFGHDCEKIEAHLHAMTPAKRFLNFNKQLLFGEIGAVIGTPLTSVVTSHFTDDAAVIAFSAVVGGLLSSSLFWLIVKIRDERRGGARSVRHLAGQIAWFSPAAFVLGLLTYQPTLFLMGRWLIKRGVAVAAAVLASQVLAFTLFAIAMNLYRLILHRTVRKRI